MSANGSKTARAQDMTLDQVSKLAGIDAERLSAYEEGRAVRPSVR